MQATADQLDVAVQVVMPSVQAEEFHARYLALNQFVEFCREAGSGKTVRRETWKLRVRRAHLITDVIGLFAGTEGKGSKFTKTRLFQNTEVTFLRDGVAEDGIDSGGLTVELYALFFRQVLREEAGLFERSDAGTGLLPSPTAVRSEMIALGRILCKCVVDGHPLGKGIGRFVFEFLADAHERRVFCSVYSALDVLSDSDPELARRWAELLAAPQHGLTLEMFDATAEDENELPAERSAFERAIIAGCRYKLYKVRRDSLEALRLGFEEHIKMFHIQLGAFSTAELLLMMRGNLTVSAAELAESFDFAANAGEFAQVGSHAQRFLRELVSDDDPSTGLTAEQRLQLLTWSTAFAALPCGGVDPRITVKPFEDRSDEDFPVVHTCSREVHLPPYSSRAALRTKLLKALEHRDDGFHIE